MKKYFITGLVILLPLALTLAIVVYVFNLLTQPFAGIFKAILGHYGLLEKGFLFLSPDQLQQYISQLIIILLLIVLTTTLGAITRWFFIKSIISLWDYVLHRIPIVSAIYKTSQDMIKTIFATETNSFKHVVMVRFPNIETYSLGLITRENLPNFTPGSTDQLVAVFVPTTPNPTSGFIMMFKEKDVIHLNMKVEDAMKFIVSCGVIFPGFNPTMPPEELQDTSAK